MTTPLPKLPDQKRGNTFSFNVELLNSEGDPQPIDQASAQLRTDMGVLVQTLTWTPDGSETHKGVFSATAEQSAAWPACVKLFCDVRFSNVDGTVANSGTFTVFIQGEITHA